MPEARSTEDNLTGAKYSLSFQLSNGTSIDAGTFIAPQGPKGDTPHIGENGNWWIGETDSGVSAEGAGKGVFVVTFTTKEGVSTPAFTASHSTAEVFEAIGNGAVAIGTVLSSDVGMIFHAVGLQPNANTVVWSTSAINDDYEGVVTTMTITQVDTDCTIKTRNVGLSDSANALTLVTVDSDGTATMSVDEILQLLESGTYVKLSAFDGLIFSLAGITASSTSPGESELVWTAVSDMSDTGSSINLFIIRQTGTHCDPSMSIAGSDGALMVVFTQTGSDTVTASHSTSEIADALDNGTVVLGILDSAMLLQVTSYESEFNRVTWSTISINEDIDAAVVVKVTQVNTDGTVKMVNVGGDSGSSALSIPTFNLTEMGLSAIPLGAEGSYLANIDLTSLREKLAQGPVKLGFSVNVGVEMAITVVANAIYLAAEDTYQCFLNAYYNDNEMAVVVSVGTDFVFARAYIASSASLPDAEGVEF